MKIILITGAAGFIGSHLAERLIKEGNKVIGVDNFVTGSDSNIQRLKEVAKDSDGEFEFERFDVMDFSIVKFLDSKYEAIDRIYHLACPASPKDFANLGVEILEACSKGVMTMLSLSEKKKARFLHASTSEVYGDPLITPQTEEYYGNVNTLGPRSCYDEGKRFAESYIMNFCQRHSIDYRIARIFNTYGEYMRKDDGRVIPNFIEQLKNDEPITIYGDGSQTRSFCYISDTIEGIVLLMEYEGLKSPDQKDVKERVFNIGSPYEIKVTELAEALAKLTYKELNTVALPLPKDDPRRRCPHILKAETTLGFSPKVSLEEGLKMTVENWG